MRVRSALARVATVAFIASASVATAADDLVLTRRTTTGREVLVRGFAEFDAQCRLKHVQSITVVDAPLHGRVETRPGQVVIGDNWVGSKDCGGTKLPGVRVFYVPATGYTGTDRFTFDVGYLSQRTVRATVDVTVQ